MTIKKRGYFEESSIEITEFTKALAHPARLEILETLAQNQICNCNDLVRKLPLAQSTISQHLSELKSTGIVSRETDGTRSQYAIEWDELEVQFNQLVDFASKLKRLKAMRVAAAF